MCVREIYTYRERERGERDTMCVLERESVCVCVREIKRETVLERESVCVFVLERERESVCVYVRFH